MFKKWSQATVIVLAFTAAFVMNGLPCSAVSSENNIELDELFHDQGPLFCSSTEPSSKDTVQLRFRCAKDDLSAVSLKLIDGKTNLSEFLPMSKVKPSENHQYDYWEVTIPASTTNKHYRFNLKDGSGEAWYNANGASKTEPEYGDFFVVRNFKIPQWLKDGVIYQIFPDRFFDADKSNNIKTGQYSYAGASTVQRAWGESPIPKSGENVVMIFFGGDLQGVIAKMPYLRETLGINILYLNPIFSSPSNHKYDTSDFQHVASCLGNDQTLVQLSSTLHNTYASKRGYLLLDAVFNHTGDSHSWFGKYQYAKTPTTQGAFKTKNSPYSSFYSFKHWPDKYATFLNVPSLPKLNYGSQKLKDAIYAKPDSIALKYLKAPYLIDGWRVDAPQYEDKDGGQGTNKFNHEIWQEFRQAVKTFNSDSTVLGEYWQDASAWLKDGTQWDSVTNFDGFTQPVSRWINGRNYDDKDDRINASEFDLGLRLTRAHYPANVQQSLSNHLSNHDIIRFAQRAKGDLRKTQLALLFQMTYLGVPTLYYGDEYGMEGGKDPDDRRTFDWSQVENKNPAITLTSKLIRLRNKYSALRSGSYLTLGFDNKANTYSYARWDKNDKIAVTLNADSAPHEVELSTKRLELADGTELVDELTDKKYTVKNGKVNLNIAAYSGAILHTSIR